MANTCPNFSSPEWKGLVRELGNSRINAMEAFQKNGGDIPALDSDIVKEMKENVLNEGRDVEIVLDKDGNQTDQYKEKKGNRFFQRVGAFAANFAAKKMDRTRSLAERKAERYWGETPHDEKRADEKGIAVTYEEYIANMQRYSDNAIAKGLIVHLVMQKYLTPSKAKEIDIEIAEIENEVRDESGRVPFSWEWLDSQEVVAQVLNNVGINYFHELNDAVDDVLRDEVYSEVTIQSDLLKMAGTIDMLVHHADGTYSIIDWKAGKGLTRFIRGMDDLIMKYGNQGSNEIVDSQRNRAKLQLALYAIILRSENPNLKFRNLNIGWIPNKYESLQEDPDMAVDVEAFMPMIEDFLGDAKLVTEAGLPADIKDKLLEKDPDIFNPRVYSGSANPGIVKELQKKGMTPQKLINDKLAELNYILAKNLDYQELNYKDKERAQELTDELIPLLSDTGVKVTDKIYDDMSVMARWIGNYSEVTHPMVQTWKAFKDKQEKKALDVSLRKKHKFNALLKPFLKEYEKEHNIVKVLGNKAYNYDKMYAWMYVDKAVNDEVDETVERLLTNTEEDEELRKRYNALSTVQKRLLDYVNEEFSSYFNGKDAFLNQDAVEENGKWYTHLELFNRGKNTEDKRRWSKGFFFKVAPTDEDVILRNGNGNYAKGRMSWKTVGSLLYRYATYFRENDYEGWNDQTQALPIKYLGNSYVDNSRAYTRNIEIIFNNSVSQIERKRHMEPVYSLGLAITNKLKATKDPNSQVESAYKNMVAFLDDKMIHDIQRRAIVAKSRTRPFRVPMYTPQGWQKQPMSFDAVIRALTKWASMNTMWVKPFQGIGNGVHATMLTHRDGLKGSISKLKFLGIDGNSIDYTEKDLIRADAAYFADFGWQAIKGDFRKSKMYLMAKELNYFGDNFEYASMEKDILSLRNRYMGESLMYTFHSLPEEFVSMTTMAAQLMSMTNHSTGKSMWDSYEVEEIKDEDGNGTGESELVWKGGVRGKIVKSSGEATYTETLTKLDSREAARLRKVHERLQGGYRRDEATALEAYTLGKFVIHLKKYFPRLFLNAFHSKRSETDLGAYKKLMDPKTGKPILEKDEEGNEIPMYEWHARITEGRWRTLAGVFLNTVTMGYGAENYNFSALSDEQKQNLIEGMLTAVIALGAYGVYLRMFDDADDDDTYKKWWKMYLIDNLSQQYNPWDMMHTIKTLPVPVAVAKLEEFTRQGGIAMIAGTNYALGNNDAAFTERGDLRGWNSLVKTIPIMSSAKDIMNKIENSEDIDFYTGFRFK